MILRRRQQAALDDWGFISPQLDALYQKLNSGKAAHSFEWKAGACMAPLPRAFRKVTAQTYPAFAERVLAGQSEDRRWLAFHHREPQRSDARTAEDLLLLSEQAELDFSAEILVLSGDAEQGSSIAAAFEQIRLIGLGCQWRLHAASLQEAAHFSLADAGTTLAPVLVTPDELGEHWREGKCRCRSESAGTGI
jgi:fumarylacetoacetate (FAA) hydrolase